MEPYRPRPPEPGRAAPVPDRNRRRPAAAVRVPEPRAEKATAAAPQVPGEPLHARRGARRELVGEDARQHRRGGGRMTRPNARPHGQVRHSQVVTTFGPGSLLDLPVQSVIVGGLDNWFGVGEEVHESRLVEKLKRLLNLPALKLFSPPPDSEDPTAPRTGITAW